FDPRNADAWFFKANCLGETDRFEEAISCYNQCLGISPDDAEALSRKGLYLLRLNRFTEANDSFDQCLKHDPCHAVAWFNKAMAEDALGKRKEVDHCFRAFLANATSEMGREVKYVRQLLQEPDPTQSIITYQPRKVV
ncbi:MAG: tetratricopeptide repeat protein, partial [Anaerolineae bacterium]